MNLPSKLVEEAVEQMATLPGVGRKTALRYILDLLRRDVAEVNQFAGAILAMRENIRHCEICYNISEQPICEICSQHKRDRSLICVVEDMRDVMAIEATSQYNGLYHVLGGKISPMEGISPSDLHIAELLSRVQQNEVREIILALSATMEGDTTSYFLFKKLDPLKIVVTTLSRGVAIGDELEYADELTLGRSIKNRTPYENSMG